jgi:uncharacterized cupin superfamily protein
VAVFNVFDGDLDETTSEPGFESRAATIGPRLGARLLGMTVYELGDEQRICPYHLHWGSDELLIVLEEEPVVRTSDGEQTLRPGDVMCFPVGPRRWPLGQRPAKVAMISNEGIQLDVTEYPDSEKVGLWSEQGRFLIRRGPPAEYYDGERGSG